MKRRGTMPRRPEIAEANRDLLATLPNVGSNDPAHTCWACGFFEPDFTPERAHVVPVVAGGSNEPANLLLLCGVCHAEQPDHAPREVQLEWLRAAPDWQERGMQKWRPMLERLRAKLVAESDEEIARFYWFCGTFKDAVESADTAAGTHSNMLANIEWAILADFRHWLPKLRQARDESRAASSQVAN